MEPGEVCEVAAEVAMALPEVELCWPFGPDPDVYKVAGKVFALASPDKERPMLILKADPAEAEALRAQFSEITPGYHMNKRHWISVVAGEAITPDLLEDLVLDSYLLVVSSLPRTRRPVLGDELVRRESPRVAGAPKIQAISKTVTDPAARIDESTTS